MYTKVVMLNSFQHPYQIRTQPNKQSGFRGWRRAACRNDGGVKGFTFCRHPELVSGSSKTGFTLIELLVVVLIIGILSAVALPQYEKAVWKSRAAELMAVTRALAKGQETFFMANGTYPRRFDELDIDINLPIKGRPSKCELFSVDSRGNEQYELVLNNKVGSYYQSSAVFIDGPYNCGGFTFIHPQTIAEGITDGKMYCWEYKGRYHFRKPDGSFCEKMMHGKYVADNWNYRIYELP